MTQMKVALVQSDFDNVWNEGCIVAVFDDFETARGWIDDETNLRDATGVYSYEPTPVVEWEIHNNGHLQYGEYEREAGKKKLIIHPVTYIT